MAFFDVGPSFGGIGVFIGVVFFLVFAGVAFFAYKMLRKSVRWAFRIAIVVVLLAIAIAGSAFFLIFSGSKPTPRPVPRSSPSK